MKIYKVQLHNGTEIGLDQKQYDSFEQWYLDPEAMQEAKVGDALIRKTAVADVIVDWQATADRRRDEERAVDAAGALTGGITGFLTTGEVKAEKLPKTQQEEFRLRMKRAWFEHVKRRPMIDKLAAADRLAVWERRKKITGDANLPQPPGFSPQYSKEEQKIFDTPIEKLMEDYIAK